ncbi:MAG: hypothetical protein Q9174_004421, partial [Haloplaca sp. 1 TL-2023]
MGTHLYILTNPRDVSEAYKNSSSLSFEAIFKLVLRTYGSSKSVVDRLYQDPRSLEGVPKISLGRALRGLNVQQSGPGPKMEHLSTILLNLLEKSLDPAVVMINNHYHLGPSSKPGTVAQISLSRFCADIIVNASLKAWFGDSLSKIDPNLAQTFVNFDTRSWQLFFRLPRFLSRKMHSARDQLTETFTSYFACPAESKADAAWITHVLEHEMRSLGFNEREMATLMLPEISG